MHQVSQRDRLKIVFGRDKFDPEKTFDDFSGVAAEIERRTVNRVGNTKNVSDEPIILDIYSPNYPDLQFTDLPGFTRTTVMGQSGNICQQIEDLNIPIIKRDNTFILAIQDSSQDIGMSTALEVALRDDIDPEGRRTVGVLTKMDNLIATTDKEQRKELSSVGMSYVNVFECLTTEDQLLYYTPPKVNGQESNRLICLPPRCTMLPSTGVTGTP